MSGAEYPLWARSPLQHSSPTTRRLRAFTCLPRTTPWSPGPPSRAARPRPSPLSACICRIPHGGRDNGRVLPIGETRRTQSASALCRCVQNDATERRRIGTSGQHATTLPCAVDLGTSDHAVAVKRVTSRISSAGCDHRVNVCTISWVFVRSASTASASSERSCDIGICPVPTRRHRTPAARAHAKSPGVSPITQTSSGR